MACGPAVNLAVPRQWRHWFGSGGASGQRSRNQVEHGLGTQLPRLCQGEEQESKPLKSLGHFVSWDLDVLWPDLSRPADRAKSSNPPSRAA